MKLVADNVQGVIIPGISHDLGTLLELRLVSFKLNMTGENDLGLIAGIQLVTIPLRSLLTIPSSEVSMIEVRRRWPARREVAGC
jgi:hypothetical protein